MEQVNKRQTSKFMAAAYGTSNAESNQSFEKGRISDALMQRYEGKPSIEVALTGLELREKIPVILTVLKSHALELQLRCQLYETTAEVLPQRQRNSYTVPRIQATTYDYKDYENPWDEMTRCCAPMTPQQEAMMLHAQCSDKWMETQEDIITLRAFLQTLLDEKQYTLTISQIVALGFGFDENISTNKLSATIKQEVDNQLSDTLIVTEALEKGGKPAVIGEIRKFGGRDYIKAPTGWKFHGKGTGAKAKEHVEGSRTQNESKIDASPQSKKKDSDEKSHSLMGKQVSVLSSPDMPISLSKLRGQRLEVVGTEKGTLSVPKYLQVKDESGEIHSINPNHVVESEDGFIDDSEDNIKAGHKQALSTFDNYLSGLKKEGIHSGHEEAVTYIKGFKSKFKGDHKEVDAIVDKYKAAAKKDGTGADIAKGRRLGTTRNGHSVYSDTPVAEYSHFTAEDHEDAATLHKKAQSSAQIRKTLSGEVGTKSDNEKIKQHRLNENRRRSLAETKTSTETSAHKEKYNKLLSRYEAAHKRYLQNPTQNAAKSISDARSAVKEHGSKYMGYSNPKMDGDIKVVFDKNRKIHSDSQANPEDHYIESYSAKYPHAIDSLDPDSGEVKFKKGDQVAIKGQKFMVGKHIEDGIHSLIKS